MKIQVALAIGGLLAFHSGLQAMESAARSVRDSGQTLGEQSSLRGEVGASTLLGMKVEDQDAREIGEVRDLLVHLPSGRIPSVVVSLGSLLGQDLWMLPTTGLQFSEDRQKMRLVLSRDELLRQEPFLPSHWPDLDNTAFWTNAYPLDPELRRIQAKQVYLATDIIGETVENRHGENLGTVRDLVVDIAIGQAIHLVLHFDPGILISERLAAVPITAFTAPPVSPHSVETIDSLLLKMSRSELRSMPVVQSAAGGRWRVLSLTGQ
jgi:sporulation protein YlmC with PRC-barrel domain